MGHPSMVDWCQGYGIWFFILIFVCIVDIMIFSGD